MKSTKVSSSGGIITYNYDKDGKYLGLIHTAKNGLYSGKLASQESKNKKSK